MRRNTSRELEDLVDLGVIVHFARDNRKLTCKSDVTELMMWHMENVRNQSFTMDLRKNSMGGTIKCIERGVYPGRPPFGFRSVGKKEKRHFIIDGDKASYMHDAFHLLITRRFTYAEIKDDLDKKYYHLDKTPNIKKLPELLRNPFYYGDFIYAGEQYAGDPQYHPQLISKNMWFDVQDVLDRKTKTRRTSQYHPYIGLIKCNGFILDENGDPTSIICGCAITAEKKTKKYKNGNFQEFNYYRCSNSTKKCSQRNKAYMKKVVGRNISYSQEEVEGLFEDIFRSFSFDDSVRKQHRLIV